jgi:hypothetical protein
MEERQSTNCVEGTMNENGLKWSKKKKIRREVRENESLNEKSEEDRSTRKIDHGQLNNQNKTSTNDLKHLA